MHISRLYKTIFHNTTNTLEEFKVGTFMHKLEIKRTFNTRQYYELINCIEYVIANRRTYVDMIQSSIEILERILVILGDYRGTYRGNAERVLQQVNKLLGQMKK